MDNYKIKVKDEAESKEAQELFFGLGYTWLSGLTTTSNVNSQYLYTSEDGGLWCGDYHSTFNKCGKKELTLPQLRDLVAQSKNEQGLISGAEAYDLIGKRVDVEALCSQGDGTFKWEDAKHLPACDILNDGFDFRLKPTTLKVNAELPKPHKETQHNSLVYAVTYEFKTREERNAFADKLRGTNS